ncbi:hypothetical protein [Cryptosporangium sp. NPDC048952]|uniref:hypothetical protein n=1 Tax=Cryptosporangium sp. NPDC048952 TaxID=3363961 RepID=UPI0037134ED4
MLAERMGDDPNPDIDDVWNEARTRVLRGERLTAQERCWVLLSRPVAAVDDTVLLAAPTEFARVAFEGRMHVMLRSAVSDALGRPVLLAITSRVPVH